jgi:hypothetical protein
MLPYGHFSYQGKPNVPKPLYGLPSAKFGYLGGFRKNSQTSVNAVIIQSSLPPRGFTFPSRLYLLQFAQVRLYQKETAFCWVLA